MRRSFNLCSGRAAAPEFLQQLPLAQLEHDRCDIGRDDVNRWMKAFGFLSPGARASLKTPFSFIEGQRLAFSSLWHKGRCDDVDVSAVHHNLICGLCDLQMSTTETASSKYLFVCTLSKKHSCDQKLLLPNRAVSEKSMMLINITSGEREKKAGAGLWSCWNSAHLFSEN